MIRDESGSEPSPTVFGFGLGDGYLSFKIQTTSDPNFGKSIYKIEQLTFYKSCIIPEKSDFISFYSSKALD